MHRLRSLVMAGAVSAVAITALGAPTAAAVGDGVVAVIQGIPGSNVDICINGQEIKSGLRYGGKAIKFLAPGPKVLKVYAKNPANCGGTRLIRKAFGFPADSDLTIVVTKHGPKVVIFDNTGLGDVGPAVDAGYYIVRHAADLGPVELRYNSGPGTPWVPVPAVDPTFAKGDYGGTFYGDVTPVQQWASFPGQLDAIASAFLVLRDFARYEVILVGTTPQNARFVVLKRLLIV